MLKSLKIAPVAIILAVLFITVGTLKRREYLEKASSAKNIKESVISAVFEVDPDNSQYAEKNILRKPLQYEDPNESEEIDISSEYNEPESIDNEISYEPDEEYYEENDLAEDLVTTYENGADSMEDDYLID